MPRLTDERREERRRHILTSAWTCFSANGFHATSMDDVIAATGMSSSAVYRYFRSKDDLIDAAADEALTLVRNLFDGLLAQSPTASPAQAVAAMVGEVRDRDAQSEYDLTRIAIQSWGRPCAGRTWRNAPGPSTSACTDNWRNWPGAGARRARSPRMRIPGGSLRS